MINDNVVCILRYVIQGIRPERALSNALQDELLESLSHATAVTLLPVVDGLSLEIELSDLAPFSRHSIEPYIAEHLIPDAVSSTFRPREPVTVKLLKAHYF